LLVNAAGTAFFLMVLRTIKKNGRGMQGFALHPKDAVDTLGIIFALI
jgi:hypothetical protein